MQEIRYFYADTNGVIQPNDENLPRTMLSKHDGLVFRFAFVPESNRIHIQDAAFRDLLSQGDKKAWHFLNQALLFLESKFNARFLEKAYGDVPGSSNKRLLSQYRKAWAYLSRYAQEDLQMTLPDLNICEYCPLPGHEAETVVFSPRGGNCAGEVLKAPLLYVNRFLGGPNGESDYGAINRAIASYYLHNLERILKVVSPAMVRKLNREEPGHQLMFAIRDKDGKTRVSRAKKGDWNKLHDDRALLNAEGMEGYNGPLVVFYYIPEQRRIVLNCLMPAADPLKSMVEDMTEKISKAVYEPKNDISVTFSPEMCSPFVSKTSRYPIAWDAMASSGQPPSDLPVVEAPVSIEEGPAALISGHEAEDKRAPDSRRFRALNGLAVEYPFILMDSRAPLGERLRAMLKELLANKNEDPAPEDMRTEPLRRKIEDRISFMFSMGMDRTQVVDLLVDKHDYERRAEVMAIAREVNRERATEEKHASAAKGVKVGGMGPGLGMNDWWYIGSQESLNRAQHTQDKPRTEPFNLKKRRKQSHEPVTYEGLLDPKRDQEGAAQKTTEQLLRESLI